MKKPVLVIMAAGMGSRYGGLKQIDKIDAAGHIIMDFSIFDAKRAGFEKVVFIIKRENLELFKEVIGDAVSAQMEVAFAFQDINNIPEGFEASIVEYDTENSISLRAITSKLEALEGTDWIGTVDVAEYLEEQGFVEVLPGIYTIEAEFDVPEDIELAQRLYVRVELTAIVPEEEEENDPE